MTESAVSVLGLSGYLGLAFAGGWLLVRAGFRVSAGDRILVGAGLGVVLTTWIANAVGRWLEPGAAFWTAAGGLLAAGVLASRTSAGRGRGRIDPRSWGLLLVVLVLAFVFFQIGTGLAIFDDRKNLSLISLMAAGEIPPRFYLNPETYFAYHYGFQLLGSALMKSGGLLPWTAFDVAKGVAGGLAVGLTVIWARQATGRWATASVVGGVLLLASGGRWLLLLVPPQWLANAAAGVQMWGSAAATAPDLTRALGSAWVVEGGPPFPLPFAYVNGVLQPLFLYLQAGPVSMGLTAMLLLLILVPARREVWGWIVLVGVGAFWALAAEAAFVLFAAGAAVAAALLSLRRQPGPGRRAAVALAAAMGAAMILAAFQGGTITEMVRELASVARPDGPSAGPDLAGFSLRETPAIVSSHLGLLRLTAPGEFLVGLAEIGPVLLLGPVSIWVMRRACRRGRAVPLALAVSALLGFLVPVFLRYRVDRDISRLTHHALVVWILLAAAPLSLVWSQGREWRRGGIAVFLTLLVLGGAVTAGPLLTAMARPVISDGFWPVDAAMTRAVWDRLAPGTLVVDSSPWRAVAVTGRPTRSAVDSQTPLESWRQLVGNPTVDRLVEAGFDYAYVDTFWWEGMDDPARQSFSSPCVREVAAIHDDGANGDRWLFDLRGCR